MRFAIASKIFGTCPEKILEMYGPILVKHDYVMTSDPMTGGIGIDVYMTSTREIAMFAQDLKRDYGSSFELSPMGASFEDMELTIVDDE